MPTAEQPTIEVERRSRADIESRASEILRRHSLFSIPVDVVTLANREGILVHNAKFSDDNLSAMIAKRGKTVTVLVNQTDVPFRKRFSIAHELGHHFLHLLHDGDFVDTELDLFRDIEDPDRDTPSKRAEVQANQFAAALLMPEELVRTEWQQTKNVASLARRFNVSEEAMGIRLSRLGLA